MRTLCRGSARRRHPSSLMSHEGEPSRVPAYGPGTDEGRLAIVAAVVDAPLCGRGRVRCYASTSQHHDPRRHQP